LSSKDTQFLFLLSFF